MAITGKLTHADDSASRSTRTPVGARLVPLPQARTLAPGTPRTHGGR